MPGTFDAPSGHVRSLHTGTLNGRLCLTRLFDGSVTHYAKFAMPSAELARLANMAGVTGAAQAVSSRLHPDGPLRRTVVGETPTDQ